MSLFTPLLAGAAAKLYDDLEDNNLLQKFRNSTLMEFLKGLHYISFTAASIEEPMFFIIQYLSNILNQFGDKQAWSNPYEHSLLYSFLLLFIIIDYKKITSFCLSDKLISIIFILCVSQPLVYLLKCKNSEYSSTKMKIRGAMLILSIILYYFSKSNTLKFIMGYAIGYLFISFLVQYYSLREEKVRIEKELKEEKEIKIEEKETEEKEIEKETEEKEVKKEIEIEEKEVKKEK
jgi:low affinity Fe/Cu permease